MLALVMQLSQFMVRLYYSVCHTWKRINRAGTSADEGFQNYQQTHFFLWENDIAFGIFSLGKNEWDMFKAYKVMHLGFSPLK